MSERGTRTGSERGTRFTETMLGTARLDEEGRTRRARLDLRVTADSVLRPRGTTEARLTGRIRIAGWADDAQAVGELEISPLARRRIRYRLTFTATGRRLRLDGWKSITPLHPLRSMTTLPFTLYEEGDRRIGEGTLRFPVATGLAPFLASFRFPAVTTSPRCSLHAGGESTAVPRSGTPPRPTRSPATDSGCTMN